MVLSKNCKQSFSKSDYTPQSKIPFLRLKQNWYSGDLMYIKLHKTAVTNRYKKMICVVWRTNPHEIKTTFSPVSSNIYLLILLYRIINNKVAQGHYRVFSCLSSHQFRKRIQYLFAFLGIVLYLFSLSYQSFKKVTMKLLYGFICHHIKTKAQRKFSAAN